MGYFSKEAYEGKSKYAHNVSNEGLEKIAVQLVSEKHQYDDWKSLDDETLNEIDNEVENLIEELKPISELSHKRHEIHSTDRWFFVNGQELSEVGDSFSDGSLVDEVNELNHKYALVQHDVPYINDEWIPLDTDSTEDIFDYFNEEMDENKDEDELRDEALNMLFYGWDEIINKWSSSVREWFRELNLRFNTDFPS